MMIKHQDVLHIFGKLVKAASTAKTFSITHNDHPSLYISSEEDILLMNQAADTLVNTDRKPATFHAN